MVPIEIAKSAASNISELTLEQAPARLLKFLQGVAVDVAIARLFRDELGWSPQRAAEGWALFELLKAASVVPPPTVENRVERAIIACESWQSSGLARVRTVLEATHPEQARFFFHDFAAGKGMTAVLNATTFLKRRAVLVKRRTDADALAMIVAAGTSKRELDALEENVNAARFGEVPINIDSPQTDFRALRLAALRTIHAWVTMWSDLARTVITRRDQLIRLGIAKRRARAKPALAA